MQTDYSVSEGFGYSRKAPVIFVMSVFCVSVCLHASVLLPVERDP